MFSKQFNLCTLQFFKNDINLVGSDHKLNVTETKGIAKL